MVYSAPIREHTLFKDPVRTPRTLFFGATDVEDQTLYDFPNGLIVIGINHILDDRMLTAQSCTSELVIPDFSLLPVFLNSR